MTNCGFQINGVDLIKLLNPIGTTTKASDTNFKSNGNDISNIFKAYTSGEKTDTGYYISNSNDISNILSIKTDLFMAVASSSTGQYLVATISNGKIYTSSDYGVTWTERESIRYWRNIETSSTGQYLVACAYGGNIFTSSDYGVTWVRRYI
jgi:hypothetical protein